MCTAERSFIPFTRNTAHEEWIQFLSMIEAATPPGKQVHLIMDNYSAHKHAAVGQWLAEHPRFHVHWTPTSGSWLNAVERVLATSPKSVCGAAPRIRCRHWSKPLAS